MFRSSWNFLLLVMTYFCFMGCQKLIVPDEPELVEEVVVSEAFQKGATLLAAHYGKGYDHYAGIFTQQVSGIEDIGIHISCYALEHEFFNQEYTSMYLEVFDTLRIAIEAATNEEAWAYVGAGKIMTAQGLGYLTDLYGAIPWTQALQRGQFYFPKYDSQEFIYNEIQRLLTEALEHLDQPSTIGLNLGDPFFNGDITKWKATAYVLQARYHNHLSKRYPSQSAADALQAIENARALGLSDNFDLEIQYDGVNSINPWHNAPVSLPISNVFLNWMLETQDPRLSTYFSQNASGTYAGHHIHCYSDTTSDFSQLNREGILGSADAPIALTTYSEALFIEAEAAFRAGDKAKAAVAYNNAVDAALRKAIPNTDGLETLIIAYKNKYASETPASVSMERIMTEKYKALFTRNIENWVDVRRHDYKYPGYFQIPHQELGAPLGHDFIRRVPYPLSEVNTNPEHLPSVSIYDRLWWDR